MRTLNLSRLARASESSFFKKEQARQALDLRKTLPSTTTSTSTSTTTSTSPDILSEISAHSTYRRAILNAAIDANTNEPKRLLQKQKPRIAMPVERKTNEPNLMRALGTGKLSMVETNTNTATTPLPGGKQYADGAFIGMASLSIASAAVASIGLIGGVVLWRKPEIIESWRLKSKKLANRLDNKIGTFFKTHVAPRIKSGDVIMSSESKHKATAFARAAVGVPSTVSITDGKGEGEQQ